MNKCIYILMLSLSFGCHGQKDEYIAEQANTNHFDEIFKLYTQKVINNFERCIHNPSWIGEDQNTLDKASDALRQELNQESPYVAVVYKKAAANIVVGYAWINRMPLICGRIPVGTVRSWVADDDESASALFKKLEKHYPREFKVTVNKNDAIGQHLMRAVNYKICPTLLADLIAADYYTQD